MSDIKIPVSAELNQQEIDQQIAQVKAALTDLARVAEQAGKTRFTPISKIDLEDVRAMRAEFEAMVRLAPALKKALSLGGQDGRSFEQVDWGKVWEGQSQRSSQASTVLPVSSSNVYVNVYDNSGSLVTRVNLGEQAAGNVSFIWDGKDSDGNVAPPGTYKFEAQATYGSETKGLYTLLPANVDSVTLGGSELMLNLAGLGSVPLSQVQVIGQ